MCHSSWSQHPYLQSLGRPLPSVSASRFVISHRKRLLSIILSWLIYPQCFSTTPPGRSRGPDGNVYPHTAARELSKKDICETLVNDFKQAAEAAKVKKYPLFSICFDAI
jgi:hypothetical protein